MAASPTRAIWKYPIATWPRDELVYLEMPRGAEVLTLQMQGGIPTLWALVSPGAPTELRTFRIVGAGWLTSVARADYVGSLQHGEYVWHFFEDRAGQSFAGEPGPGRGALAADFPQELPRDKAEDEGEEGSAS